MMESFLIYPYNLIFLVVGIILIVVAFVFISRSKKREDNEEKQDPGDSSHPD